MSHVLSKSSTTALLNQAAVFAALGDETRLSLLVHLGANGPSSVAQLSAGRGLTRQAIRKHLALLEEAELIRGRRSGRENLFQLEISTLRATGQTLEMISGQWGNSLERLKQFVEQKHKSRKHSGVCQ